MHVQTTQVFFENLSNIETRPQFLKIFETETRLTQNLVSSRSRPSLAIIMYIVTVAMSMPFLGKGFDPSLKCGSVLASRLDP